jgi:aspartyl/asparaginyl beta-hydroxylase (cupin superfamily)
MPTFAQITTANAQVDRHLVETISQGLKRLDFDPVIAPLKKTLAASFLAGDSYVNHFISELKSLVNVDKAQRYEVLLPLLTQIIEQTDTAEQAFFASQDFPWIAKVEQSQPQILAEFERVQAQINQLPAFEAMSEEQLDISDDDKWKVLIFKVYGEVFTDNLALFPTTAAVLEQIPDCSGGMFSILKPGKIIPPHEGPYKGVLRYHLGVVVPDDCGISVNHQVSHWQVGKSLVFDDSFEHHAWNRSSSSRTVLFVDFLRPLPFPLNLLNQWLVLDVMRDSPFVQEIAHNKDKYQAMQTALATAKI